MTILSCNRPTSNEKTPPTPHELRPIPEFPGYFIARNRDVYSQVHRAFKGKRLFKLKVHPTPDGIDQVFLYRDRKRFKRNVAKLLREVWGRKATPPGAVAGDPMKANAVLP